MNNICITGRLTSAPEIKKTTSGVSVCSVSVAVDRDYKVNGEKATDFIPCISHGITVSVFVTFHF